MGVKTGMGEWERACGLDRVVYRRGGEGIRRDQGLCIVFLRNKVNMNRLDLHMVCLLYMAVILPVFIHLLVCDCID